MDLATFVKKIKRRTQLGSLTITTDQVTQDIIDAINDIRFKMWRAWAWDWSVEQINSGNGVAVAANSSEFTLDSNSGQLLVLFIRSQSYLLKPISLHYYLMWKKTKDDEAGTPTHYIRFGRDSSNNLKYKLWKTSNSAVTLDGWAKKRLTEYTVASISSNTEIEFFPEEVQDILLDGVEAIMNKVKGDMVNWKILFEEFKGNVQFLIGEEQRAKPDEMPTLKYPRWLILSRRQRGSGTTVT